MCSDSQKSLPLNCSSWKLWSLLQRLWNYVLFVKLPIPDSWLHILSFFCTGATSENKIFDLYLLSLSFKGSRMYSRSLFCWCEEFLLVLQFFVAIWLCREVGWELTLMVSNVECSWRSRKIRMDICPHSIDRSSISTIGVILNLPCTQNVLVPVVFRTLLVVGTGRWDSFGEICEK